jgi:extracellular factor (EF) 3-hydroxypalmitic acid methyl ester biosynthesis protein
MLDRAFDAAPLSDLQSHALRQQQIREESDQLYIHLFDDVQRRLLESQNQETIDQALDELVLALRERMMNSPELDWKAFVAMSRRHPITQLLHQDPFTFRAFSKPRGYAGDAEMMDFIYGCEDRLAPPPAERIGRYVFDYTTRAPAPEGVRARRAFMAARIDRLAEEKNRPHILAIAAGHLREASVSIAVRRRRTGRFVALDADPQAAIEVKRCYASYGVETVTASFSRLLGRQRGPGEFDLVYSTGLLDYLNQRTSRRLVLSMFQMLRSGGSLVVANFLPGIRDIGYMETFMDWNLIYRTRGEMIDLTADIPESEVKQINLLSEECKNIIFLQLTKC